MPDWEWIQARIDEAQSRTYELSHTEHVTFDLGNDIAASAVDIEAMLGVLGATFEAGYILVEYQDDEGNTKYAQTPISDLEGINIEDIADFLDATESGYGGEVSGVSFVGVA